MLVKCKKCGLRYVAHSREFIESMVIFKLGLLTPEEWIKYQGYLPTIDDYKKCECGSFYHDFTEANDVATGQTHVGVILERRLT